MFIKYIISIIVVPTHLRIVKVPRFSKSGSLGNELKGGALVLVLP